MEIERKFLIKKMPNLSGLTAIRSERYYLKRGGGFEERIQKKGSVFEHEKKTEVSNLERTRSKEIISEEEFERLKPLAGETLIRDSYIVGKNISIKKYHGRFEGLSRAEIEFDSAAEARAYQPESWMGQEITDSPLGRDSRLLDLSEESFKELMISFSL